MVLMVILTMGWEPFPFTIDLHATETGHDTVMYDTV
jgi:hypothetical protein